MGDKLKHEFSMEPVDTGRRMPAPSSVLGTSTFPTIPDTGTPGMSIPGTSRWPSIPDIPGTGTPGTSIQGVPVSVSQPGMPVTRPSFLQAFLANLGPALAGGLAAQPGMPFGTGLGGAMQGIQQRQVQQQEFGLQQQSIQLRAQQERIAAEKALEYQKNIESMITTRANPPAKNQIEQLSRDYTDALSRNDQAGAKDALDKINAISTAKKPPPATSPWGKLSPEMAAIGVPPNPNDKETYPQGMKDPKFQADVQTYGSKVSALKQQNAMQLAGTRGESYAFGRAKYMQIPVLDKNNDNQLGFATALEIARDRTRYEPASLGATLGAKEAIFQDMDGASKNLRVAYQNLKTPFNSAQAAKMSVAMNELQAGSTLGQAIHTVMSATGKAALAPDQQDVAIGILQNTENAFALRMVAGFGQSSDQLRGAIKATIPNESSPPGYALKQLDAYDAQRERIHRGIPKVSVRAPSGPTVSERPVIKLVP